MPRRRVRRLWVQPYVLYQIQFVRCSSAQTLYRHIKALRTSGGTLTRTVTLVQRLPLYISTQSLSAIHSTPSQIMQFTTLSTFTTLAFAAFVAAGSSPSNQCSTGPIQCCNSVQSSKAPGIANILELVGINAGSVTGQVGLTCSPVGVASISGNSW